MNPQSQRYFDKMPDPVDFTLPPGSLEGQHDFTPGAAI